MATPEIADAVVVDERNLVINAKAMGETDIILWITNEPRRHYRVSVRSPADRKAVLLSVRIAEVRKNDLEYARREPPVSRSRRARARRDRHFQHRQRRSTRSRATSSSPATTKFATLLTDFGTKNLLSFIDAEATLGHAKILAEPNLLAGNHDTASFLAGGEIPVPIAQPSANGAVTVTIQYREFGIRLTFIPEIVSDSLIKLNVHPEVSSLDFTNAVVISGFRIPALRTRRIATTVDVKPRPVADSVRPLRRRARADADGRSASSWIFRFSARFRQLVLGDRPDRAAHPRDADNRQSDESAGELGAAHFARIPRFPARDAIEKRLAAAPDQAISGARLDVATQRKVLIIGEAAGPPKSAADVLHRFGFVRIDDSPTLNEATPKLRAEHYDLVIAPIDKLSNVEMTLLEREIRRESSLLIGTAPKADADLILTGMRAGVQEFLVSPPDPTDFAAALDRLVRRSGTEAQRGLVMAVFSGKGGLGTTSVALNLAYGLAVNHPDRSASRSPTSWSAAATCACS